MAIINFQDLVRLVNEKGDWRVHGSEPPETVLDIALGGITGKDEEVLDANLASQTITYEARDVTVVLDFDDKGYLVGIEFV